MADHLEPNPHMTRLHEHNPIMATFIGQAHIAGTGPECTTCSQCKFWGIPKTEGRVRVINSPGHYALSNKKQPGAFKKGGCHYAIRHKSNRRFFHFAQSCRFFVEREDAPAITVAEVNPNE